MRLFLLGDNFHFFLIDLKFGDCSILFLAIIYVHAKVVYQSNYLNNSISWFLNNPFYGIHPRFQEICVLFHSLDHHDLPLCT